AFLDYAASRYEKGDVQFICANFMEVELRERFDLVFANQIVEHLIYPLDMVKRLSHLLKPGGRLVMTTPNWRYLKNSLPRFSDLTDVSQYHHLQFSADADGHFFAYTGEELKNMFAEAGFSQIRVSFFETPFISGHMKFRYLHGFVGLPILKFFDRMLLKIPGIKKVVAHQLMIEGILSA
ncbi:MAG TPA: methyltransferase domain-containing protein, partial [Dissulfurispiraceae bacterium]|nr:methyltransferase domain-containing protein [Dissulfurispiraceae bacterium]